MYTCFINSKYIEPQFYYVFYTLLIKQCLSHMLKKNWSIPGPQAEFDKNGLSSRVRIYFVSKVVIRKLLTTSEKKKKPA